MYLCLGMIIGALTFLLANYLTRKKESDIEVEEYISNTGRNAYKIFKTETGINEKGKKEKYRIYLGEVSEED